MAELTTLARPYAKAAFEYARKANEMQAWSDALTLLAVVSQQGAVQKLLSSPAQTAEQKSTAIIEVCGEKMNPAQQNFIRILADNKRLVLLVEIQHLFELYKAALEKAIDVEVQTAFEIEPALQQKLRESLTKKLEREVTLQTSINKDLIGGALIRAGDTVIDGSVRGRLAKLAEAMGV